MAPPRLVPQLCLEVVMVMIFVLTSADPHVKRLGQSLTEEGKVLPLSQANITFLLEDLSLVDGILFAISADFRSRDGVRVQVWRPNSTIDRKYWLLWDAHCEAPGLGVKTVYFHDVPGVHCPAVQQGDRLGIYAEAGPMPIAYKFLSQEAPATLRHPLGARDSFVRRGQAVTFDALRYPYRFFINAFVYTDPNAYVNTRTIICPNVTVDSTAKVSPPTFPPFSARPPPGGSTGHTGPAGPPGPPGPAGVVYPALSPSTGQACGCNADGSLLHNHIILAIFVWLTAITVLNLCFLIFICCRHLRKTPKTAAPAQTEPPVWVEKVRETVREYNGNATGMSTGMSTALTPVGPEGKLRLEYEVPFPEGYEKDDLD